MKQWLSGHWKSVNSDCWHKSSNWGEPCSCPDYCLEKVPRPQHRGEDPKQSCTFSLSLVDGIGKLGTQRCLEFIGQNTEGKSIHYTERKFQSCAEGHPQPFSWVLLSKTCEDKNWGQEKDHGEDIGGQTSDHIGPGIVPVPHIQSRKPHISQGIGIRGIVLPQQSRKTCS